MFQAGDRRACIVYLMAASSCPTVTRSASLHWINQYTLKRQLSQSDAQNPHKNTRRRPPSTRISTSRLNHTLTVIKPIILFFLFCLYFIFNCCHLANKLYQLGLALNTTYRVENSKGIYGAFSEWRPQKLSTLQKVTLKVVQSTDILASLTAGMEISMFCMHWGHSITTSHFHSFLCLFVFHHRYELLPPIKMSQWPSPVPIRVVQKINGAWLHSLHSFVRIRVIYMRYMLQIDTVCLAASSKMTDCLPIEQSVLSSIKSPPWLKRPPNLLHCVLPKLRRSVL